MMPHVAHQSSQAAVKGRSAVTVKRSAYLCCPSAMFCGATVAVEGFVGTLLMPVLVISSLFSAYRFFRFTVA
ncbi:hypothetical protein, partial [Phocaeicola sp.]